MSLGYHCLIARKQTNSRQTINLVFGAETIKPHNTSEKNPILGDEQYYPSSTITENVQGCVSGEPISM